MWYNMGLLMTKTFLFSYFVLKNIPLDFWIIWSTRLFPIYLIVPLFEIKTSTVSSFLFLTKKSLLNYLWIHYTWKTSRQKLRCFFYTKIIFEYTTHDVENNWYRYIVEIYITRSVYPLYRVGFLWEIVNHVMNNFFPVISNSVIS
jgi:hypothetical protein